MSGYVLRQDSVEPILILPDAAETTSQQRRARPLRVLMVCSLFTMAYRIMRCTEATGAEVYVLGNEASKGFRYSLACKQFLLSHVPIDGSASQDVLDEINRTIQRFKIDVVIAGDAPGTRTVCGLKDKLGAPCFPYPSLEQFDFLNNKWYFTQMCAELGVATPPSRLFTSKNELLRALDAGELTFPCMSKALSMEGNHGIHKLYAQSARVTIETIDYFPVLVQDFIPGEDIGTSVYCENGVVKSYILHILKRATYTTFHDDSVRDAVTKIMKKMGCSGVYNFDMRMTDDGKIYYLECNPRLFFKSNLSMLAGINFVQAGLPGCGKPPAELPNGTAARRPKALALTLLTAPWKVTRRDFATLWYMLSDPLPYFREMLRLEWEP
jgi:predicted ATP-grasp superfamily ATP-dependent carboligase